MLNLRKYLIGLIAASALLGGVGMTQAATSGYVTGDANNKPIVNLKKTSQKNCKQCGVIAAVRTVEDKGKGSGVGAVGGAVVGGVLGHQIGSGRGNTLATVGGAVGGAVAGNEVEKHVKKTKHWDVHVKMDDQTTKEIRFADQPSFAAGNRVQLVYTGQHAK
jgi:outer membrane lipoprotein SlyB